MPTLHPYLERVISAAKDVHPEPTQAQREAGNFRMGHVHLHGLDITIETAAGQIRSKVGKDGKKWSRKMHAHYGYLRGSHGADGDHCDVFVGPHPQSQLVFIVDQLKKDGTFDEHKIMLGCINAAEAKELYLKHYPKDWTGFGGMKPKVMSAFKKWVTSGATKRPALTKNAVEEKKEKRPSMPGSLAKVLGLTGAGAAAGYGAAEGTKVINRAIDYHPEALQAILSAQKKIHADYSDPLRNLVDYAAGGHQALSSPVYGNTTGLDIMQKVRSAPDTLRKFIPGLQRGWDDDLVRAHYENANKGVGPGLSYMIEEATRPDTHGADQTLLPNVSMSRQQALQDTVGSMRRESSPNASYEDFHSRYLDNFLKHFRSSAKPGNPVSDDFLNSTGKSTLDQLEKHLPDNKRLSAVWDAIRPRQTEDGISALPISEATLDAARAHADPGMLRTALGYPKPDRHTWPVSHVRRSIAATTPDAATTNPTAQADAIHTALKDDPAVQHAAAATNVYFGSPGAIDSYGLLGRAVAAPGEAMNWAADHSHYLPWMAGSAAGLYGLSKLLRRAKSEP